jgi:hypothetical protein
LTPNLPAAQGHRFELPTHTAFNTGAGEVALDETMASWIAGIERIVMEVMFQECWWALMSVMAV